MGKWKSAAATTVAAGAIAAGVAGFAPPASAQSACLVDGGHVCFFEDIGLQGSISIQKNIDESPHQILRFSNSHFQNGDTLNDNISSVYNGTNLALTLFEDFDESGPAIIVAPRTGQDFAFSVHPAGDPNNIIDFNDAASSAILTKP